jgi:pilus assembly protein CpaF
LEGQARPIVPEEELIQIQPSRTSALERDVEFLKIKAQQKLLDEWDSYGFVKDTSEISDNDLRAELENITIQVSELEKKALPRANIQRIIEDLFNEIRAYGPITDFIEDETVSEVMVNGPSQVYVERQGKLESTEVKFRDDAHVIRIIDRIISPLSRHLDESSPMVDARLPDGSRINAIIHPLSIRGPILTIRKFAKTPLTVANLIEYGTFTDKMAKFFQYCVEAKLNILVSGGTGSGKTTSLNVISSFIPEDERIVTIEDAAELRLQQQHVIPLETRPPNIEGKGAITQRDLVRNALRMRPDRIILGEVRGGEALDMLQAMNTGHDGSLSTLHANTPRDAVSRLETMVMMAGMDLPVRAIREQIASAIDLIIQQSRLRDGSRRIVSVTEVVGMEGEIITLQELFAYQQHGKGEQGKIIGNFVSRGLRPKFSDKFEQSGITVPIEVYTEGSL